MQASGAAGTVLYMYIQQQHWFIVSIGLALLYNKYLSMHVDDIY